jgi:hypothetical protein
LEQAVEAHIRASTTAAPPLLGIDAGQLHVIKYLPAKYLTDVITGQHLYAAERAGFTWGDALYVAPVRFPRTTMMYGEVGVVGVYETTGTRMFDAAEPAAIALYQEWITWQKAPYLQLTTTVHAYLANRTLRNEFRNRFRIDCVYFRPDESCADYVDSGKDWWLAITHWDASDRVASGYSQAIKNLRWCVRGPDSFMSCDDGRGYSAYIHTAVSGGHTYTPRHYSSLSTEIMSAYTAPDQPVVLCDFK